MKEKVFTVNNIKSTIDFLTESTEDQGKEVDGKRILLDTAKLYLSLGDTWKLLWFQIKIKMNIWKDDLFKPRS